MCSGITFDIHVTGMSILRHRVEVDVDFLHFWDDVSMGKPNNMLSSTKILSTRCLPAKVLKIYLKTLTPCTTGLSDFETSSAGHLSGFYGTVRYGRGLFMWGHEWECGLQIKETLHELEVLGSRRPRSWRHLECWSDFTSEFKLHSTSLRLSVLWLGIHPILNTTASSSHISIWLHDNDCDPFCLSSPGDPIG